MYVAECTIPTILSTLAYLWYLVGVLFFWLISVEDGAGAWRSFGRGAAGAARGVFLFMSKRDCTEKNSRVVLERVSRGRYDKYIESHAFGTDLFVDSATLLTIDTFFSTYRTCRFNVFELNELTGLGILTGEVVLAIPT